MIDPQCIRLGIGRSAYSKAARCRRTSLALGPRFCGGIKKGAEASMLASKRGMSELVNALPLTIKADEERFA